MDALAPLVGGLPNASNKKKLPQTIENSNF